MPAVGCSLEGGAPQLGGGGHADSRLSCLGPFCWELSSGACSLPVRSVWLLAVWTSKVRAGRAWRDTEGKTVKRWGRGGGCCWISPCKKLPAGRSLPRTSLPGKRPPAGVMAASWLGRFDTLCHRVFPPLRTPPFRPSKLSQRYSHKPCTFSVRFISGCYMFCCGIVSQCVA